MTKATVIAVVIIMILSADKTKAGVSVVQNGSFEDDGTIADIVVQEPNNWDVNVPAGQFGGGVYDNWWTEGSYSLTLYSWLYGAFDANDIATVSQQVYLTEVNEIFFDLNLDTFPTNQPWDPNKRTAVLMIDDVVVWESNSVGTDVKGEYLNQSVNINFIEDSGLHKLSLGIRVDVNEITASIEYYADFDDVRFYRHCEDFGFLAGDFNRDCHVDMNDLKMLMEVWLDEVAQQNDPNDKYDLSKGDDPAPYGTINFFDFAIFADTWDGNIPDLGMFVEVWLNEVEINHTYNLFHDDDVYPNGIINFNDFAVFAENWMVSSYN